MYIQVSVLFCQIIHVFMCLYTYIVIKTESCFSSTSLKCGKQGITMLSDTSCVLGALQVISLQTHCVYIIPLWMPLPQLSIFSFATKLKFSACLDSASCLGFAPCQLTLRTGCNCRHDSVCALPDCRAAALLCRALRFCHQNQESA